MGTDIKRYLEDAIAAEKSFETQLGGFAKEASLPEARSMFEQHADETRTQYELLTSRLNALGGSTSTVKSLLAHIFNMAPKAAQIGHVDEERTTQDLIMAFSVENAEVAMYEALSIAAEMSGDRQTADLAREIQAQEQQTADKVWNVIERAAKQAFEAVRHDQGTDSKEILVRYLQDAEAAERNFEDALASFSKMGDQPDVQSLLATMSKKALTQHDRLEARLTALGATRSTAKSMFAHVLAFTPVSAQMGHAESEKSTQHLMITYSPPRLRWECMRRWRRVPQRPETRRQKHLLASCNRKRKRITGWRGDNWSRVREAPISRSSVMPSQAAHRGCESVRPLVAEENSWTK